MKYALNPVFPKETIQRYEIHQNQIFVYFLKTNEPVVFPYSEGLHKRLDEVLLNQIKEYVKDFQDISLADLYSKQKMHQLNVLDCVWSTILFNAIYSSLNVQNEVIAWLPVPFILLYLTNRIPVYLEEKKLQDRIKNLYYLENKEIFDDVEYWRLASKNLKKIKRVGSVEPNTLDILSLSDLKKIKEFAQECQKQEEYKKHIKTLSHKKEIKRI